MRLAALTVFLLAIAPAWAQTVSPVAPNPVPPPLPANGPPPLPQPSLPDFYIGIDGAPVGPLGREELEAHVADGTLTADTLVWTDGQGDWMAAVEVPEIAALLERPAVSGTAETVTETMTPAEDAAAFVVGSWRTEGDINIPGLGPSAADITQSFAEGGAFTANGVLEANIAGLGTGPIEMTIEAAGEWSATSAGGDQLELSLTSTTTISAPSVGMEPQSDTSSETSVLTIVDNNTIRDGDGLLWSRVAP
jgi:hypothetical protein